MLLSPTINNLRKLYLAESILKELIKILIHSDFDKRKELINNLGIDLFSHELLSKIMSKILTDESIENSKIIDYFSEKSERDFISGLLMEEKEIQNPDLTPSMFKVTIGLKECKQHYETFKVFAHLVVTSFETFSYFVILLGNN